MSFKVLIVEDEGTLRNALARGIAGMKGVEVQAFASAEEALEELAASIPDLAILDMNLPGMSGLDLVENLAARERTVPVIVTTAYTTRYREKLTRHSGLTVLEKPVSLDHLRKLIGERQQASGSGEPQHPFQVTDYLQLAAMGRHSLTLAVEMEGGVTGRVEVVGGEVWNVFAGDRTGADALALLVSSPLHRLRCGPLDPIPTARQLEERSEHLLLEIARRQDEAAHGGFAELLDIDGLDAFVDGAIGHPVALAGPEGTAGSNPAGFQALFSRAISAYLERRYEEAAGHFERCLELRPGDHRVFQNLARIRKRRTHK